MCRLGMKPVVLIGIWTEAGEARHFCRKIFFFKLIKKILWISFLILQSFWLRHKTLKNLFFLTLNKNKFGQSCRTKVQANNNLDNIYISKISLGANIKFTGLAGLIHVQARYEVGSFNRDLTRGRWGRPFFFLKKISFRLINKGLWISCMILQRFWLRHRTS